MVNIDLDLNSSSALITTGSRLSFLINVNRVLLDNKIFTIVDIIKEFSPFFKKPRRIRLFMEIFLNYISDSIPGYNVKKNRNFNDLYSEFDLLCNMVPVVDDKMLDKDAANDDTIYDIVFELLENEVNDRIMVYNILYDGVVIFVYKALINNELNSLRYFLKDGELSKNLMTLIRSIDG